MKLAIAQAERVRHLQTVNINNLFDCEKKQAEDEKKVAHRRRWPRPAPLRPPE